MSRRGTNWTADHAFTKRHNADLTSESRLWRKCLIRAIYDAAYGKPRRRVEILKWMQHEDFDVVCDYATVDPDYIHQRLCEMLCAPRAVRIVLSRQLKAAIYAKDNDKIDDDDFD